MHHHAYWVCGLRARDNSKGLAAFATVDVQSHALVGSEPDLNRFAYAMHGPPSAHTVEGEEYVRPGQAMERYNGFRARFENVKSVTLDGEAMGLNPRRSVRFSTTSDGPTQLRLAGPWPVLRTEQDGRPVAHERSEEGVLGVEIPAGEHRFEVRPIFRQTTTVSASLYRKGAAL